MGQTQEVFASHIPGTSQAIITRLEKGKTEALRFEIMAALIEIARSLGVPLDWLLTGDEPLELPLSPDRFAELRGIDVPPGVKLICQDVEDESLTTQPETDTEHAMDGAGSHPGSGE